MKAERNGEGKTKFSSEGIAEGLLPYGKVVKAGWGDEGKTKFSFEGIAEAPAAKQNPENAPRFLSGKTEWATFGRRNEK